MKKNNKGFSLVELIIVIAIMAILAGALAPALIKYINKSRKSTDIQNADSLRTAIQTALSNPDAADVAPAVLTAASKVTTNVPSSGTDVTFYTEVHSVVGSTPLKTKYKSKANGAPAQGTEMYFKVDMATNTVQVFAGNITNYELSPSTCKAWTE